MIQLDRTYTDKGIISAGSGLYVQVGGLYQLLIPTTDLPATKGAPDTLEKTVLTDSSVTQIECLQTNDQKEYTFNYHRDNIRRLKQFAGEVHTFIERNGMDFTGEKFTGTLSIGRDAISVNGVMQGKFYITVNNAEELEVIPMTLVNESESERKYNYEAEIELATGGTKSITLETSPNASFSVSSEASAIATVSKNNNTITITGVSVGSTFIDVTCSASDEATSTRTIMVIVSNAVATLSSIAITTAPTDTSYIEGQHFNPAGMVVTATYSDTSTAVVSNYTYSPTTSLTTANTTITVSYTENGVTKTATQAITVASA